MKHTIRVQMFGMFRMEYDGKPLSADRMHRDGQFMRVMQVILHYSETGISKHKLEEYVVGERDIDAPHTALRVIVYKTKKKLEQLGIDGQDWIYLEDGMYYWTKDIEVISDTKIFEQKYKEAQEILNTTDEAEIERKLQLYLDASYLYKGDFLQTYAGETWVAQEAKHYRELFQNCVNGAASILRKQKEWKILGELGRYASKVEPLCNWEVLIMESLVETGNYDKAVNFYTTVADYYLKEYGIYPTTKLLEILDQHVIKINHSNDILENIQEKMNEEDNVSLGGYECSYPVFRGIYQLANRRSNRTNNIVYLMLCTMVDENGKLLSDAKEAVPLMEVLRESISSSIRQSDAFTQYSKCQYLILLIMTDEKNGELVKSRINHTFIQKQTEGKKKYHVNCVFTEV